MLRQLQQNEPQLFKLFAENQTTFLTNFNILPGNGGREASGDGGGCLPESKTNVTPHNKEGRQDIDTAEYSPSTLAATEFSKLQSPPTITETTITERPKSSGDSSSKSSSTDIGDSNYPASVQGLDTSFTEIVHQVLEMELEGNYLQQSSQAKFENLLQAFDYLVSAQESSAEICEEFGSEDDIGKDSLLDEEDRASLLKPKPKED